MGEGEGRRCGGGEGMWGREESRRQMGLAGDRWVRHDVDRSPAGSEMAAQAGAEGVVAQMMVSLRAAVR